MAKGNITQVAVTDTFQQWLTKTNDLVTLMNGDVMTASPGGDTTIGNSTLQGNFTANNVTANVTTGKLTGMSALVSEIRQQTGNTAPIAVADMMAFSAANTLPIRLSNNLGPRIRYDNQTRTWDVGHGGATANSSFSFLWDSSVVGALTTAGFLELVGGLTANGNSSFGSGSVQIGSGVVANPSLAFSVEPSTGIYRPQANTLAVSVWGVQRLIVSNTAVTANVLYRGVSGVAATPAYSFTAAQNAGMYYAGGIRFAVGGTDNVLLDSVGNIALWGTGSAVALRTINTASLDLDANSASGVRIGRNSPFSKFTVLRSNTTFSLVELEGLSGSPTANGGYVRAWQGPDITLPAFSFIGDANTGMGRTAVNTVSLISANNINLSVSTNNATLRAGIGLSMGNYASAPHNGDTSPHLSLYGYGTSGNYGLGVTSSSFNLAAPPTATFRFVSSVNGDSSLEVQNNNGNGVLRLGGSQTASTPGYSFINDPDTGIWRYASNGLGITVGGTERARFGIVSQFFGSVQANSFNLIDAAGVGGGGFLGVAADAIDAPSYSWSGDTDTGMWHAGTNSIGFTTAALNRVIINASGIALQNDGRFIASNRQDPTAPDYCFSGAGNYGMYYASNYLRFSAAGTQVLVASNALTISYNPIRIAESTAEPMIQISTNPTSGFGGNSSYPFMILNGVAEFRFDALGNAGSSVITRTLGDARYVRTSSKRFKDQLVQINDSLEERLLKAFDLFDIKTWIWGKELDKNDERVGTRGIGLVVEDLENFIPEAVRYQWKPSKKQKLDDPDYKETEKQPHALDDSPIMAAMILKIRQLEARLAALEI